MTETTEEKKETEASKRVQHTYPLIRVRLVSAP